MRGRASTMHTTIANRAKAGRPYNMHIRLNQSEYDKLKAIEEAVNEEKSPFCTSYSMSDAIREGIDATYKARVKR